MLVFGEFVADLAVAFVARFRTGKGRFASGNLFKGGSAIVAVLAKGPRGEYSAGDRVSPDDPARQKHEPSYLGRHPETGHNGLGLRMRPA